MQVVGIFNGGNNMHEGRFRAKKRMKKRNYEILIASDHASLYTCARAQRLRVRALTPENDMQCVQRRSNGEWGGPKALFINDLFRTSTPTHPLFSKLVVTVCSDRHLLAAPLKR